MYCNSLSMEWQWAGIYFCCVLRTLTKLHISSSSLLDQQRPTPFHTSSVLSIAERNHEEKNCSSHVPASVRPQPHLHHAFVASGSNLPTPITHRRDNPHFLTIQSCSPSPGHRQCRHAPLATNKSRHDLLRTCHHTSPSFAPAKFPRH